MWLFTTQGFYSVVADRDDPHRVLVRARARGDIEALRDQTPDLESIESAGSDYRWRAFVSREDWTKAVAELATAIDYDNFKNAVGDRQGRERGHITSKSGRRCASCRQARISRQADPLVQRRGADRVLPN